MRQFVRSGLAASITVAIATIAGAQAPGTGQPKGAAAPPKAAAPGKAAAAPPRPAILDQVLAIVNGEPITRGDLYQHLNSVGIPPGQVSDQQMFEVGIEGQANYRLVGQFLAKQNIPITEKEVDAEFERNAADLKKDGRDINVAISSAGLTVPLIREEIKKSLRWHRYIKSVAPDAVLKKYMEEHKDVFNRTQVKASHIVLRVDPAAPAAEKEKVKQKLLAIKAEIDGNRISFADAANKYSEDDGNKTSPAGGDLGYFTRRGTFEATFTAAAFAIKKGSISDPVETPYGYHLIQVTDRKDGAPTNFEESKLLVLSEYTVDLQEKIVAEMRKTAKIDIKPMPADLFPKAPASAPTPGGAPPATKAASPATPK